MSEKQPIQDVFLASDSDEAKRKQLFLETQRIICARVPGAEPPYRLTWERMNEAVTEIQESILASLREAEDGERLAEQYLATPGKQPVILTFLSAIQNMMANSLQEYEPQFGFDMDVFLHVEATPGKVPTFCCELFPRTQEGRASSAVVSKMEFVVPLIRVQLETLPDSRSHEGYSNLQRFVFDGEPWGGDLSSKHPVIRKFFSEKGVWLIRKRVVVAEFVLYVALSFMEYGAEGQRKLLAPLLWRDEEDLQRHAELHTVRTARYLTLVK